jgi:NADPH:quinone reductase-like Zn-dependent oxidoreductase
MRRIVIAKPGGYEALQLVEAPDPVPGPGEVRVRVEACGVNYADGIIRMGLYASAKELHGYPITPGFEVAGVIDAIGQTPAGAPPTTLQLGQRVVALTLFGGYTSHLCLATHYVFPLPDNLTTQQAAALPAVFLTAWFMVHEQLHPRPGQRWLVHSAAGGVGGALVQLGRLCGAEVTGVVGAAHKVDAVLAMGASQAIDKSGGDWRLAAQLMAPDGFDAVFDANGVATLGDSYRLLAPMGKLFIFGFASMLPRNGRLNWLRLAWDWLRTPRFNPMHMTQSNRSVMAANLSFLSSHAPLLSAGMVWLLERFANGELQPPPVETFALAAAADAHRRIESGQTIGKLVLVP